MTLALSILCLFLVLFMTKIENNGTDLKITPIFALGMPYSIIMVLVAVFDIYQDFFNDKLIPEVPIISIILLLYFFSIGRFITFIFLNELTVRKLVTGYNKRKKAGTKIFNRFMEIMLFGVLFVVLVINLMKFGFIIKDVSEFKTFYSSGVAGHTVNLCTVLFIFCFALVPSSKIGKVLRFISLVWPLFLVLANAKYSALMYATTLLIINILNDKNPTTYLKIIAPLGLVSSLFLITYFFRFLIIGLTLDAIPYEFIFRHFFFYLTNGFYTFSNVLTYGILPSADVGYGVFWAPIMNIYNLFTDNKLVTSMSEFVSFYQEGEKFSNTFTLFGSLLHEMGWIGTLLSLAVLSTLVYIIYLKYLGKNGAFYTAIYSFMCSTLIFSFFNSFYGTVNIWEKIIMLLLFTCVLQFKFVLNRRI